MIGVLHPDALAGRAQTEIEHADGSVTPLWADDWRRLRPGDASLLDRCSGPTLEVGSGPGRLTVALAERGVPALGIDGAPDAVRIARSAGSLTLLRDVFSRVPGTGRWMIVLLADGNIGIGGDPTALLHRVAELLAPLGQALVEVQPPGRELRRERARLRHFRGHGHGHQAGDWFPWAQVGADQLSGIAREAGLSPAETWSSGGRWFATLKNSRPLGRSDAAAPEFLHPAAPFILAAVAGGPPQALAEAVAVQHHRIGPRCPDGREPVLGGLQQRRGDALAPPGGADREPVQMTAPAIPARDDRADQLTLVLSHDHRVRITAEQGRHRRRGIGRPLGVLRRLDPQPQQPVNVSGRAGAQYHRHSFILPETQSTQASRRAPPASSVLERGEDVGRRPCPIGDAAVRWSPNSKFVCARFDAADAGRRAARFLVEWELLMLQPMVRRIALGAMQAALAATGIFVIMLLFSRPAHAATAALPRLTSTRTATGLTAAAAASPVTSVVSSIVPVGTATSAAATAAAPVTSTATPVASTVAKTLAPVTRTVAPVATTAAKTLAPVTRTVAPVATTVGKTLAPITGTVAPVVTTVTKTLAPVTDAVAPVITTVGKTLAPITRTVAPVTIASVPPRATAKSTGGRLGASPRGTSGSRGATAASAGRTAAPATAAVRDMGAFSGSASASSTAGAPTSPGPALPRPAAAPGGGANGAGGSAGLGGGGTGGSGAQGAVCAALLAALTLILLRLARRPAAGSVWRPALPEVSPA